MHKTALLLVFVLVMSLFSSSYHAEAKPSSKVPTLRGVQNPTDDKSVKIIKTTQSRFLQVLYIVTVEICAGKDKLYSPELSIKSDTDSIIVKISGLILPKTCRNNDFFIRADNPDTISVIFSSNQDLERIPH